jgi:hypothetical protein
MSTSLPLSVERWALSVGRFPKIFFNAQLPTSNAQLSI